MLGTVLAFVGGGPYIGHLFMGAQSLIGLSIRVYHYLKFHLVAESSKRE